MGLPQVNIVFKTLGATAIQRGERGIVALLLKDTDALGVHVLTSITDIPTDLSVENKKQIELAFIGGERTPNRVVVYVYDPNATVTNGTPLDAALNYLETVKFDYFVFPEIEETDKTKITTWIGLQRANGKMVKAVLPHHAADKEYIINFTTENIVVGDTMYTAAQYCSRIAGLIAGTPLTISTTFQPLSEVDSVQSYTKDQLNEAIDNGEFVIYHDGEKVKVGRGVTSLVTTTQDKGDDFKKIKIVDILDLIYMDIRKTIEDKYIGKYANSYDNKVLLIQAINAYYEQLEIDGLLDTGKNSAEIDLDAQRVYLRSIGVDVDSMKDQQIKEANTRDKVFLLSRVRPLDAIEDIDMKVLI